MRVKKEFPYPCYDPATHEGDLKLLQVRVFDCLLKSHRTFYNLANNMKTFPWCPVVKTHIKRILKIWTIIKVKM